MVCVCRSGPGQPQTQLQRRADAHRATFLGAAGLLALSMRGISSASSASDSASWLSGLRYSRVGCKRRMEVRAWARACCAGPVPPWRMRCMVSALRGAGCCLCAHATRRQGSSSAAPVWRTTANSSPNGGGGGGASSAGSGGALSVRVFFLSWVGSDTHLLADVCAFMQTVRAQDVARACRRAGSPTPPVSPHPSMLVNIAVVTSRKPHLFAPPPRQARKRRHACLTCQPQVISPKSRRRLYDIMVQRCSLLSTLLCL